MKNDTIPVSAQAQQATPAQRKGFGVAASPFNGVKLELAIIIILGIVLELMLDSITQKDVIQIGVLAGYGLLASGWIILRTRFLAHRALAAQQSTVPPTQTDSAHKPSF